MSRPKREKSDTSKVGATRERNELTANTTKKDSILGSIVRGVQDAIKELNTETSSPPRYSPRPAKTIRGKGFCIRCGKSITFNTDAPYCPECFRVWNKFKDPEYEEKYCHSCGKSNKLTTLSKPLCYSCFKKLS